jgi:hypothetical protein
MRPDPTDPTKDFGIEWYFVPKGTPVLGLETIFVSSIWDEYHFQPQVGELRETRKWWPGGPPRYVPLGPPGLCGTPEQWLNGWQTFTPCDTDPLTGQCLCCGRVDRLGLHDTAGGGRTVWHYLGGSAGGGSIAIVYRRVCFGGSAGGGQGLTRVHLVGGGGSAGGGHSATVFRLVCAGGSAGGGDIAENPMLRCLGGSAGGGRSSTRVILFPAGGSAAGGNAHVVPQLVAGGGSAGGGRTRIGFIGSGGSAGGGRTSTQVILSPKGGSASGGTGQPNPKYGGVTGTGPCPSVAVSLKLRLVCTRADAAVSAFLGATTDMDWNGTYWIGNLTVGGNGGVGRMQPFMSQVSVVGNATMGGWNFTTLMPVTPTCGPPFHASFTNVSAFIGINSGTTDWTVDPTP